MENKKVEKEKADSRLRKMCDGLSPQHRRTVVVCSLAVFTVLAFYMAVAPFIKGNRLYLPKIEQIRQLDLPKSNADSINSLKINDDDDK